MNTSRRLYLALVILLAIALTASIVAWHYREYWRHFPTEAF